MAYEIRHNNTTRVIAFLLVSSADHITGQAGGSPAVEISKNGGTFAVPSGAVDEIGRGWYMIVANASDANTLGPLLVSVTMAGADPYDDVFQVVAYDPDDPAALGLTRLDDNITHIPTNMLAATVPHNPLANTVARALQIARGQGAGKWVVDNDILTVFDTDNTTAIGVFALTPSGGPYTARQGSPE